MKNILFSFFFLVYCGILFGQKNDHVWMSGAYNSSDSTSSDFLIDFIQFPPLVKMSTGKTLMSYANISMSNWDGVQMFYSNGCGIMNTNNDFIENGSKINSGTDSLTYANNCGPNGWEGSYPVFQGIFSIPFKDNNFSIFHTRVDFNPPQGPDLVCSNNALLYTNLDMNANQGLGKVIFEDSILIEGCLQTACANRHANGRDWWIILPDNINHRFYRFLSTPEGIYGPWEQNISNPTIADTLFYLGWSEFSPNGESMLIYDVHTGTAIYDFDRCTGLLSNLRYIPADIPLHGYGTAAAFSSDSRFIYIVRGNFRKIDQFDLMASDLQTSKITIATWDGTYDFIEPLGPKLETSFGYFQHGPDGKLYNWAGNSRFMHVTNFPNRKGLQCDFKQRVLSLPYYNNGANNYYPNYRLGPIDGSACDSLGIDNHPVALYRYDLEDSTQALQLTYTDLSYYEPTYWHWDFGDGTTSQDTSPVHNYATAGIYQVCLIVGNAYSADTFCNQVMVGASGIHELVALPHVNVHPNPFTSKIQIEMPALIGTKPQFSLYNWLGQKVKSVLLDDFTNTLHVSDIPTGIYVWQLSWNGFATQQGKLIKAVK